MNREIVDWKSSQVRHVAMRVAPHKNCEVFDHLVDLNWVFKASFLLVETAISLDSCHLKTHYFEEVITVT